MANRGAGAKAGEEPRQRVETWTQATTTRLWPHSERFRELMAGDPPEHWLPRSQWHTCWLLHDPEDAEHQRAYAEALAEGETDEALPGYAAAIAEHVVPKKLESSGDPRRLQASFQQA